MPDYIHILQEFLWQYNDFSPKYPKTHKFLQYWDENIEGFIETAEVSTSNGSSWRKIDLLLK